MSPLTDLALRARRTVLCALALWLAVFSAEYALARAFEERQVLSSIDMLFNADAGWFLTAFADGRGTGTSWGGRSLIHPNVANWVNPAVRAVAPLCSAVAVCEADAVRARRQVATAVAPVLAATAAVFLFLGALCVFRDHLRAVAAAILNAVLFPSVIFGALRESYGMTACAFAALFYLVCRESAGKRVPSAAWLATGTALAGVTLTNLVPFAIVFGLVQRRRTGHVWRAAGRTVAIAAAAIGTTAALAVTVGLAYGALDDFRSGPVRQRVEIHVSAFRPGTESFVSYTIRQVRKVVPRATVAVPAAFGHTIVPARATVRDVADPAGTVASSSSVEARVEISYEPLTWATLVALTSLAGAAWCVWRMPGGARLPYQAAGALIAYNWIFHAVFGTELFLYATHWSLGIAVLLWGWLDERAPYSNVRRAVAAALFAVIFVRNLLALQTIFGALP